PSQRAKNIRLGPGITVTPPPYNPPGRIAERISALDLISDGRVEFGTGESSTEMELGAYHVPWDEKKAMWEEGVRVVTRMMTEEPFAGYDGDHTKLPLCILSQFACAKTEEEAVRRAGDGGQFFSFSAGHHYNPTGGREHQPGRTHLYRQFRDTPEEERLARLGAAQARRAGSQLDQLQQ